MDQFKNIINGHENKTYLRLRKNDHGVVFNSCNGWKIR